MQFYQLLEIARVSLAPGAFKKKLFGYYADARTSPRLVVGRVYASRKFFNRRSGTKGRTQEAVRETLRFGCGPQLLRRLSHPQQPCSSVVMPREIQVTGARIRRWRSCRGMSTLDPGVVYNTNTVAVAPGLWHAALPNTSRVSFGQTGPTTPEKSQPGGHFAPNGETGFRLRFSFPARREGFV
jgi:hypothetical protein